MKSTVTLETKDVRTVIAKFLGVRVEDVVSGRYTYSVMNISADTVATKIYGETEDE